MTGRRTAVLVLVGAALALAGCSGQEPRVMVPLDQVDWSPVDRWTSEKFGQGQAITTERKAALYAAYTQTCGSEDGVLAAQGAATKASDPTGWGLAQAVVQAVCPDRLAVYTGGTR